MSRPATGTLAWARATGGALDRRARLEQLRHAVTARLRLLGRRRSDGMATELSELGRQQAQMRPRSRIALLNRLGFQGLVRRNPLDVVRSVDHI